MQVPIWMQNKKIIIFKSLPFWLDTLKGLGLFHTIRLLCDYITTLSLSGSKYSLFGTKELCPNASNE